MAVVARTYARALFDAAKEHGRIDEVREELDQFVAAVREVPERDPYVHTVATQATRIPDERTDVLAPINQKRQEGPAHGAGRSGEEDHAGNIARADP